MCDENKKVHIHHCGGTAAVSVLCFLLPDSRSAIVSGIAGRPMMVTYKFPDSVMAAHDTLTVGVQVRALFRVIALLSSCRTVNSVSLNVEVGDERFDSSATHWYSYV